MAEAKSAQDEVMPLPSVKRMLSMAESEPLGCAFGVTKDKKDCMLLVEKTGSAKKVAAKLKAAAKSLPLDVGTIRFGTVGPALPDDPGTVRFTINRSEAGGTVVTLTRLAKKAGYGGIVINVDAELDKEPEEGVAASGAPAAPPPPQPQAPQPGAQALTAELAALARRIPEAAGNDPALKARLAKLATDTNVNLKTNNLNYAARFLAELREAMRDALEAAGVGIGQVTPPAQPSEGAANLAATAGADGAVKAELAALMRRIPEAAAAGATVKAQLLKLAADANAGLKAQNVAAASAIVAELRQVLRDALDAAGVGVGQVTPTTDTAAKPDGPAPRADEWLALLRDAKDEVDVGLNKLADAMRATGDPDFERIADYGLYGMTQGTGVGLMKALMQLRGASSDRAPSLAQAASSAAAAYKAAVFSHPLADLVDANPFGVAVGLKAKLGPALDTIAAAG